MSEEKEEWEGPERRKGKDETRIGQVDWHHRWKAILAMVYAVIIIFDFILLPAFKLSTAPTYLDIISSINELDAEVQKVALTTLTQEWQPLTMFAGGMFHIAMGAILTGAAISGRSGLMKK